MPGLGATSAASPGPSATKRRKPLVELFAERTQLSALGAPRPVRPARPCAPPKPCCGARYCGPLQRHRPLGATRTPAWQLEPSGRPLSTNKEQKQLLESPDLAWWSRHKARRAFADAGGRFDKALLAWENTGQPYATRLEAERERFGAEVAQLEQARASREDFFTQHPEVPSRLAELDRAIAREQENERRRSWELLKEREQARRLGISQDLDRGYGMEL